MQEKIWSKTKVAGPLSAPDTLRHYSVCAFAWGMPGEIPGENFLRTAPANTYCENVDTTHCQCHEDGPVSKQ